MQVLRSVIRTQHVLKLFLLTIFILGSAGTAWTVMNIDDLPIKGPAVTKEEAVIPAITGMEERDDGLRLRHRYFTATFTGKEVHFLPLKGGPDWHWQWTYAGTEKRLLQTVNHGNVSPAGDVRKRMVRYERGGIVEQYLARPTSMEQQFVISRPLDLNGGDLVIEGSIRSDGIFEKSTKGWLWRSHEGVVSLGDVYVHDAKGNTIPAVMKVTATGTRIVVDGDALALAFYPVTIDPEVGANDFRISDMGPDGDGDYDAYDPAVAYNTKNNEYLVVWWGDDNTAPFVEGESEIFGQRINAATGAEVGSDFRISDMGPDGNTFYDAFSPAVAYNSTNNEYLVVWEGEDNTGLLVEQESEIFGQRINAATGAEVGSDFRISDMGGTGNINFDARAPAVATTPRTTSISSYGMVMTTPPRL